MPATNLIGSSDAIKTSLNGELLQRSSQRKKTRKTFGDDFLDLNLTQLSSYSNKKQKTYNRNCSYCRTSGELIFCKYCKSKAHPKCFRDNRGWVRKGYKNYNAICIDCRPCDMCNQGKGKLQFCFRCKCAYHFACDEKLSANSIQDKDNWQCSLCDKISVIGRGVLNDYEWGKEVQRRRAIRQRELFGKPLKCLPVSSFYDPIVDGAIEMQSKASSQEDDSEMMVDLTAFGESEEEDKKKLAGADERSAVKHSPTESASNQIQNNANCKLNVEKEEIKSTLAMNPLQTSSSTESNNCSSLTARSTLDHDSSDLLCDSTHFVALKSLSANQIESNASASLELPSSCAFGASNSVVEQIEIGSSVEIGEQDDPNELEGQVSRLDLPGLTNSNVVATSNQCSPYTSNENTCDETSSLSFNERFPITLANSEPANEHRYACSTNLRNTSVTSHSVQSSSRSSSVTMNEKQLKRLHQEKMNKIFLRTDGTELLKEKLFIKACRAHLDILSPKDWSAKDVALYVKSIGFEIESEQFQAKDIDGHALLKLSRREVLYQMGLKLGPALKLYAYIYDLQKKNNVIPNDAD